MPLTRQFNTRLSRNIAANISAAEGETSLLEASLLDLAPLYLRTRASESPTIWKTYG